MVWQNTKVLPECQCQSFNVMDKARYCFLYKQFKYICLFRDIFVYRTCNARVITAEYFTRHYRDNSKFMTSLIQLNKVFALWVRSLSMHPNIWNKLMSMHLKSHVNAFRSEILFPFGASTIYQCPPKSTIVNITLVIVDEIFALT